MGVGSSRRNKCPKAKGSVAPLQNFIELRVAGVWSLRREKEK